MAENFNCLSALSLILFLAGCTGHASKPASKSGPELNPTPASVTIHAGEVFDTAMIGQTWVFQNGYGDQTVINVQPAQFCEAGICDGKSVIWHYTKSPCRAYWQPGVCGAELWFVIHQEADGSWRSIASKINFPKGCPYSLCEPSTAATVATQNPQAIPGMPLPYTVIPASGTSGQAYTTKTAYISWWQIGVLTDDVVALNFPVTRVAWSTTSGVEQIDTPKTGAANALVSEQFEDTVHEKWWFAPGLGLVKVAPIDQGHRRFDPKLVMLRVR
jgi:hypothetical protein